MGLYFRKSIKINKFLRLNVSKTGISMSATIPGTGLHYSTPKIGGLKLERERTPSRRVSLPYSQTVTNEYTGESRTVRAATERELRDSVHRETARQAREEYNQRLQENSISIQETAAEMTEQQQRARQQIDQIIADTLLVDDKVDWAQELGQETVEEFVFSEPEPKMEDFETGRSLFRRKSKTEILEQFTAAMAAYNERYNAAYREYLLNRQEVESDNTERYADTYYLRERFEKSEPSAVEKYIAIVLANSRYPDGIDLDYDVRYVFSDKTLIVNCLVPPLEAMPIVDRYTFSRTDNSIQEKRMPDRAIRSFYQNFVFSVAIRTVHEMFESIYTDAVNIVVLNAYTIKEDSVDTDDLDDYSDVTRCVLSMKCNRLVFENIDLGTLLPEAIVRELHAVYIEDFLSKTEEITPIRI